MADKYWEWRCAPATIARSPLGVPLFRSATKIILMSLCIVGGSYGIFLYERNRANEKEARLQEALALEQERNDHLKALVNRLSSERRMAEMVVTEQTRDKDGQPGTTTLLFSEFAADGSRLPPRFYTIVGNEVHIDALVIKFERDFVEKDDPLRGHTIALFYRLYGSHQTPENGFPIDNPGQPPDVYRDGKPRSEALRRFESELWQKFWKLADDPSYRADNGVRVMQGEGLWRYVYPDYVYTLTIERIGGPNIHVRPIDDLFRQYQQALKKSHGS
jgi:hypothetical protein